jgi:hypothetical protein
MDFDMPKRFTDSNKWKDAWFMDLPAKYKLFWLYILDDCDHAGIWRVNFKVANFHIGEHLEPAEVKRFLNGRLTFISDDYWRIDKFVDFQYGGIKNDQVGKSVQNILKKHDLLGADEGLDSPLAGTKDKDKAKDEDKGKNKVNAKLEFYEDKVECFNEWQSNERLIEEILMLIQKFGFTSANRIHVINIFRNFLLVEFSITKTKSDHEHHLRRWVNKMGKKIHEYAS